MCTGVALGIFYADFVANPALDAGGVEVEDAP